MKSLQKHKRRISLQLFLSFLLIAALIIAAMWLGQTVLLEKLYESTKADRANEAINSVVSCLDLSTDELNSSLDEIARYYDVNIAIYNGMFEPRAEAVSTSRSFSEPLRPSEVSELRTKALENGGRYSERSQAAFPSRPVSPFKDGDNHDGDDSVNWLITVAVVNSDSGSESTVVLTTLLTPLGETGETLNRMLLYVSAVAVVLSLILAGLLSRRITHPLVSLNRSAAVLAKGDYSVSFDANSGCCEIDELADTLNYATEQLSQVDRLRTELVANLSHDLRTPLTVISGYAEMMRDLPEEDTKENLDVIIDESGRLTRLVKDVLTLSRTQSESAPPELSDFSLTATVEDEVNRMRSFTAHDGYNIEFAPQEDLTVTAEPTLIHRVLYNLLINAVTYTGDDHRIFVCQSITEDRARIDIIDTGAGMTPQETEHVFERYYRSRGADKKSAQGSGLGLAIVKASLDRLQASFGVTSTPGQGSDFWFELPLAQATEDTEQDE